MPAWLDDLNDLNSKYGRQWVEQNWNQLRDKYIWNPATNGQYYEPGADWQMDQWLRDRQSEGAGGGGLFGIKELSGDALGPLAAFLALGGQGGMTAANALTGGDVGKGALMDAGGLAAGAGLSAALPSLGLSTAGTAAAGTSGASPLPLADALKTAAATGAGGEVVNGLSEPAPAPPPSAPKDIQLGPNDPATTGGGYKVDPITGNVIGSAAGNAITKTGGIGGTSLNDILSGNVGLDDLAKNVSVGDLGRVLGTGAATLGSMYADNQRADAQKEMYNQYLGLGAPSRARYEASFAPGFDVNSIPGFTNAMDTSANTLLRKLSASGGNPWGNPGGLAEVQNYIMGNVALPALNSYRNQNAATGGFGAFSTAAPGVGSAAIDSGSSVYSDLGRGASDIFNPPTDLGKILRQYQATSRGGLV